MNADPSPARGLVMTILLLKRNWISMQVFWLEQNVAEVRADDDWFSEAELAHFGSMRIPKRRKDWRLGRWTAKHAVAAYLGLPADTSALAAIEIRATPSGAPEAFLDGSAAPVSISLSHREGRAVCAVGPAETVLGCDLEVVEPRPGAFVSDYFTHREQQLVTQAPPGEPLFIVALLWSAKESMLKALHEGLRIDTRQVEITLCGASGAADKLSQDTWHQFRAQFEEEVFHGWWRGDGQFVLTFVSQPASEPPVRLYTVPQVTNPQK
jgi:4'-phosphopantetheinyl transferase